VLLNCLIVLIVLQNSGHHVIHYPTIAVLGAVTTPKNEIHNCFQLDKLQEGKNMVISQWI